MRPFITTILLFLSLSLCAQKFENDSTHPRLVLDAQGFKNIHANIEVHGWAKKMYQDLLAEADRWVDKQVVIPPRGGNWLHYYVSPKDGSALKVGKEIGPWQWEHISTATGEVFKGDSTNMRYDFDGCALYIYHNQLSHVIYNLGAAFQLTGDVKYANKAESMLLAYTDIYLKLPIRDKTGGHNLNDSTGCGHVFNQSLDEAAWLITIVQGADMIWDRLSDSVRYYIRERFILPATDVIIAHRMEIHNIQCWKNAAVGLAGFLLRDKRLIEHAMKDSLGGFNRQLKEGATTEGLWWERSPSYHFYAVAPIIFLAQAAIRNNYPLDMPAIKRLFDGPIALANSFLTLPAFNDSNPENLMGSADLYTWAYAHFEDENYLQIISSQASKSIFALAFRKQQMPPPKNLSKKSINMADTKFAILTKGPAASATWLCFKYDPNTGGWHSQDDKLSFVLYKGNQEIAVDPGVERYGAIQHKGWFLSSFAHNTMLVDEEQQSRAGGEMILFGSENGADFLVSRCKGAYEGVELRRSIALLDTATIIVIDQFLSNENHVYDVSYHQQGTWQPAPTGKPWIGPDKRGYKFLTNAAIMNVAKDQALSTQLPSGQKATISVHAPPGKSMQLITASGVYRNNTKIPAMIFRQSGKEALFVWCISLDGKPVNIKSYPLKTANRNFTKPSQACAVSIKNNSGKKWTIYNNPDRLQLRDGTNVAFRVF